MSTRVYMLHATCSVLHIAQTAEEGNNACRRRQPFRSLPQLALSSTQAVSVCVCVCVCRTKDAHQIISAR
jgi:hypothetical protein